MQKFWYKKIRVKIQKFRCKKFKNFGVSNIQKCWLKKIRVKKQTFWCKKIGVENFAVKISPIYLYIDFAIFMEILSIL